MFINTVLTVLVLELLVVLTKLQKKALPKSEITFVLMYLLEF